MTPLALRITRALTDGPVPASFRRLTVPVLTGAHFFEATGVLPLVEEVRNAATKSDGPFIPCTFLPAPKTWVEWLPSGGERRAICFVKGDVLDSYLKEHRAVPDTWAVALLFRHEGAKNRVASNIAGWVDLATGQPHLNDRLEWPLPETHDAVVVATYLLAIINSPRIVGRHTHPPRKTVARKLERSGIDIGPLHDWHEIKLEVNKPRDVDDGETHSDVITGKRCLHFVRKFIRIRLGRLEYVREHWRGDASVGVRRGRYVVTA